MPLLHYVLYASPRFAFVTTLREAVASFHLIYRRGDQDSEDKFPKDPQVVSDRADTETQVMPTANLEKRVEKPEKARTSWGEPACGATHTPPCACQVPHSPRLHLVTSLPAFTFCPASQPTNTFLPRPSINITSSAWLRPRQLPTPWHERTVCQDLGEEEDSETISLIVF